MGKGQNYNKQKKKWKIGRRIGVWFLTLITIGFAVGTFSPKDAGGNAVVPSWYGNAIVFAPILVALFYDKIKWRAIADKIKKTFKKRTIKKSHVDSENFVPPRTRAGQKAIAEEIGNNIKNCILRAANSSNVLACASWCDDAVSDYSKLEKLDKITIDASLKRDYSKFKDEFQLLLCNAIVRQKESVMSKIKGEYKNSREFQRKALEGFEYDLNILAPRFSTDTAELAANSVKEIRKIIECETVHSTGTSMHHQSLQYCEKGSELMAVDLMDGHAFEHWCAELLKKNGFKNVQVTPGSGDQGVDVLAEKGGIKYAIQCKCYSKDLGNTPVQEVNAGRMVYRCQIGAVMTNRYFTQGAKDAAAATGVLLWDREKLQEFILQASDRP